jgi:hypothetical protein
VPDDAARNEAKEAGWETSRRVEEGSTRPLAIKYKLDQLALDEHPST